MKENGINGNIGNLFTENIIVFVFLSGKRGSNPWPQAWEACALPTELLPQCDNDIEPIPGLEPGTHALRMRCSTNWAISAWFGENMMFS